ncbi:hypothetical protein AAMO2058_000429000 [Amorphochlora amoebiformis]
MLLWLLPILAIGVQQGVLKPAADGGKSVFQGQEVTVEVVKLLQATANDQGSMDSSEFHSKVYEPVRQNLVKMIQAMWDMAKTADAEHTITVSKALNILQTHIGHPITVPLTAGDEKLNSLTIGDSNLSQTAPHHQHSNSTTSANSTSLTNSLPEPPKCTCPDLPPMPPPPSDSASAKNASFRAKSNKINPEQGLTRLVHEHKILYDEPMKPGFGGVQGVKPSYE